MARRKDGFPRKWSAFEGHKIIMAEAMCYLCGYSFPEIADFFDSTPQYLSQVFRRFGIPCRGYKEAQKIAGEKRRGIPVLKNRGANNPNWKGGTVVNRGYLKVLCYGHPRADSRGRVSLQYLVMEKYLGHYTTKEEVIHHIDEDPGNNNIDNLELFPTDGAHSRFHRLSTGLEEGWRKVVHKHSQLLVTAI